MTERIPGGRDRGCAPVGGMECWSTPILQQKLNETTDRQKSKKSGELK